MYDFIWNIATLHPGRARRWVRWCVCTHMSLVKLTLKLYKASMATGGQIVEGANHHNHPRARVQSRYSPFKNFDCNFKCEYFGRGFGICLS